MQIGVAYSEPGQQIWLNIEVPDGATVNEAIARSGILKQFPNVDLSRQRVGVEEVERRCLAGEVHRKPHPAVSLGDQHDDGHEGLAGEEHRHEPPRDDLAPGQSEQRGHDVETVGDRPRGRPEPRPAEAPRARSAR